VIDERLAARLIGVIAETRIPADGRNASPIKLAAWRTAISIQKFPVWTLQGTRNFVMLNLFRRSVAGRVLVGL